MNDSVMKKEYPNESQRSAVCHGAWDKKYSMLANYLKGRGWSMCQIEAEIKRIESRK